MTPTTTIGDAHSSRPSSLSAPSPSSQGTCETQRDGAAGDLLAIDQARPDTQAAPVVGDHSPAAATLEAVSLSPSLPPDPLPSSHRTDENPTSGAAGESSTADHLSPGPHRECVGGPSEPPVQTSYVPQSGGDGWLELRIWAEMLHDAQVARIAGANRAARGGVDPAVYAAHIDHLESVEHACALALRRCFRRVAPAEIVAWQKAEKGVGEHLLARLLGHLGDPLIASPHRWMTHPPEGHECDPARCGANRHLVAFDPYERTVSQLWAYCGHGDPQRRKSRGMTADDAMGLGSPTCKMLLWNLSVACMKQKPGSRYRDIYERRRVDTVERVHATPCVRCGPSGRPAPEGSPWSKAHQHADALRIVGKELLRDLWVLRHAARGVDAQNPGAGGEHERKAS